jgi:hypothetical protein
MASNPFDPFGAAAAPPQTTLPSTLTSANAFHSQVASSASGNPFEAPASAPAYHQNGVFGASSQHSTTSMHPAPTSFNNAQTTNNYGQTTLSTQEQNEQKQYQQQQQQQIYQQPQYNPYEQQYQQQQPQQQYGSFENALVPSTMQSNPYANMLTAPAVPANQPVSYVSQELVAVHQSNVSPWAQHQYPGPTAASLDLYAPPHPTPLPPLQNESYQPQGMEIQPYASATPSSYSALPSSDFLGGDENPFGPLPPPTTQVPKSADAAPLQPSGTSDVHMDDHPSRPRHDSPPQRSSQYHHDERPASPARGRYQPPAATSPNPRVKTEEATIEEKALHNPVRNELARLAPPGASPLPKAELVRKRGYVMSRISFRTIIMKKWKQSYWVQYGPHTMLWFRAQTDFEDWLNNPYHNQQQRNFLIKLAVNFVHDLYKPNVRGYQVTQCRTKAYGSKMVRQFKLERWMDYGPTIAAAFGSYDPKEVDALREALVECMRNTPLNGGIRATGAIRQRTNEEYGRRDYGTLRTNHADIHGVASKLTFSGISQLTNSLDIEHGHAGNEELHNGHHDERPNGASERYAKAPNSPPQNPSSSMNQSAELPASGAESLAEEADLLDVENWDDVPSQSVYSGVDAFNTPTKAPAQEYQPPPYPQQPYGYPQQTAYQQPPPPQQQPHSPQYANPYGSGYVPPNAMVAVGAPTSYPGAPPMPHGSPQPPPMVQPQHPSYPPDPWGPPPPSQQPTYKQHF